MEGAKKHMSRLTCTQCEGMLLDAADGTLLGDDEAHFRLHLEECPACSALYADIRKGSAWMDVLKQESPEPPAGLVDRILQQTSGDPLVRGTMVAQSAHAASLFGNSQGAKILPFREQLPRTRWARMVNTIMQPRFAMTAAMAFFSIALTLNLFGVHLSSVRAADLKPTNMRRTFWNANSQLVRYYDNLRVVYELESRVREMQSDSDKSTGRGLMSTPEPATKDDNEQRPAPTGQPHSSTPFLRRGAEHLEFVSTTTQTSAAVFPAAVNSAIKTSGKGEQV